MPCQFDCITLDIDTIPSESILDHNSNVDTAAHFFTANILDVGCSAVTRFNTDTQRKAVEFQALVSSQISQPGPH